MKKIDFKIIILFLGIVLLAIFLRFSHLDQTPPSLNWDETSWGYNAYSILMTGKDEYGSKLPLIIRSFNDYKPGLYAYLLIPFISVFGLSDFIVRFPNALFGVLTVITTYFLAKELFKNRAIAFISMFLMAISPWSIQFSRFAHEGIVGLEFNLLMAFFFIKGMKNPKLLCLSALFAGLSLYSYQNEKVFVPLFGLILLVAYIKDFIIVPKKYISAAFMVGLVVALPIIYITLTNPASLTRAKGASFLNNPIGVLRQDQPERILKDKNNGDVIGLAIDNRRISYVKEIVGNYLVHYDPNFLFINGDVIPRHQASGMGHLYLIELPFLLLGLYFFVFGKFDRKSKIFVILWILIVPIAASITWDVPNSGRTLNFLPTFQMIIAIGIVSFYFIIKNAKFHRYIKYGIFGVIILLATFNFIYYLNQYFVQYRYFNSQAWQYGYNQIIPVIEKEYPNYKKIHVGTMVPLDQSYIFFLYGLRFDPATYQKTSSSGEYQANHNFDKFEFSNFDWKDRKSGELYIGKANQFSGVEESNIIKRIKFLDGSSDILIVKN